MVAYVIGSTGLTLNSSDDIRRMLANAASSPHAAADPRQPQSIAHEHRSDGCRCAPSAMRMPISRVRCDTEYEITP